MGWFRAILLAILLLILFLGIVLFYRPTVISAFQVHKNYDAPPDLIVLLEGGGLVYSPTRERLEKVLELYRQRETNILVCAYEEFKKDIVSALVSNGVRSSDIVQSQYAYNASGGTYNNVLEMMDALRKNEKYSFIEIVTSPYHERRVDIMFSNLMGKSNIKRGVYVRFPHIMNSDIYYTNNERYLILTGHELFGMVWFYLQMLQNGLADRF